MRPRQFTRDDIDPKYRDRFWLSVDVRSPDECWNWQGHSHTGYGRMTVKLNGSFVSLPCHRMAYILKHGEVAGNLYLCHRCDNRLCCNPDHLWPGTSTDNNRDMYAKGRGMVGENHYRSILTAEQVSWIRKVYTPFHPQYGESPLARKYGVNNSTIARIVRRQSWKSIA